MNPSPVNTLSVRAIETGSLGPSIAGAREIYVSGCSAEIAGLPDLLGPETAGATVTGIFSPILNTRSYADPALSRRCRTFFLNDALRNDLVGGAVDFCPWTYSSIAQWLTAPARFDAAVVMVSPPDENNHCSFGTQTDFLPEFYADVPRLIGVINPNMPRTWGTPGIPLDRFSAVFEHDMPLPEFVGGAGTVDPINDIIARNVAGLIPERATLQMGIGRVSQAVTLALVGHRGLRIHSGLVDDNVIRLEEAGALDPSAPIVTGVAIGTRALYDMIDRNPRFSFRTSTFTHSAEVIGQQPAFIAVNTALQVDLFGQVNSEGSEGRMLASPGGLPDFLRGAQRSKGGLRIIALRAQRGRRGKGGIVGRLCEPHLVTAARYDIDLVVTENGVADLRGRSLDQRAEALIEIADPADQATLAENWSDIRQAAFA